MSALKAILAELDVRINEDRFLLTSLTRACRINNDKVKIRHPIRKGLLALILHQISQIFSSQRYLILLYQAIFAAAYYGLLCISKVAKGPHTIKAHDVHIGVNKDKMLFTLRTFKTHGEDAMPQLVKITGLKSFSNKMLCPFVILRNYVQARQSIKNHSEVFFVFKDRSAIPPSGLWGVLHKCLVRAGFDAKLYSFHSLRSDHASDMMKMGISVETIKKIRRWKSNAIFCYLRH